MADKDLKQDAPSPGGGKSASDKVSLGAFQPTDLEDLPEESLLRTKKGDKGGAKDKFLGQAPKSGGQPPKSAVVAPDAKKGGKAFPAKLTCPMSGASISVKAPSEAKKVPQFAADSPTLTEKQLWTERRQQALFGEDDVKSTPSDDTASRRGSKHSGSTRGSGAKNSGYASSGRISGSRPSQRGSRASRGSDRRRRRRKVPTFSEWEADTYIPHIKNSWNNMTTNHSKERLSLWFTDKMLEESPELSGMIQQRGRMVMASHFWTALDFCSKAVDEPPRLAHNMKHIAAVHVEEGVTCGHVATFGKVLFLMLKNFLGDEMDLVTVTSWEWLWTWLSSTMNMAMEEANEEATLVSQSWDIAQISYPGVRFGQLLLDNLFALAPNLRQTFVKPKQLLSVKFAEMVATLVTFNGDLATMEEQIVWLGVRHVGYGARIQHLQVFGQVLMNSMETALGEEWTFEMHKSWMDLWNNSANKMLEVTQSAEKYGEVVRELWERCKVKTTPTAFGGMLRTSLLSGTEWVQEATSGIKQGLDQVKNKNMDISLQISARDSESKSSTHKGFLTRFSKRSSTQSTPAKDGAYVAVRSPMTSAAARAEADSGSGSDDDGEFASVEEAPANSGRRPSVARSIPFDASFQSALNQDQRGATADEDDEFIHLDTQSDDGVWGQKFWNMITEMLNLLWEPERMSEFITSTTWRLYAIGIRPSNIAQIGTGIGQTIRKILGREYKELHGEAWTWFWEMASKTMDQVLTCMLNEDAQIVRTHWEECKTIRYAIEIGELIFQEIGRLAPHVVHLFKKPKKIQSQQFVAAIDIIVSFNEDPAAFFDLLRPLAIRHIRYGVRPDYTRVFGKAILRAMKVILGSKYTPRVALAFETLWLRVSTCMTRALAGGSNLIVVALINENIDQLVSALDGAPRCERFDFLTELRLNGDTFSPLYWAIKESQLEIAQFIIDDLLAIRADRHNYYYGREVMFQRHPDLMRVLCQDMPQALPHLFNGLMWHARLVANGGVRVNFYLKEMYGEPQKVLDPWKGPLGVLVLEGSPEVFVHPVVRKLLSLKYDRFGLFCFAVVQFWFLAILAIWSAGSTVRNGLCNQSLYYCRLTAGALGALTFLGTLFIITRQFMSGQWSMIPTLSRYLHLPVPRYLLNPWNSLRFVSLGMLVVCLAIDPCQHKEAWPSRDGPGLTIGELPNGRPHRYLSALTVYLIWFLMLQFLVISEKCAAFFYTIGSIFPEIVRNFAVIAILLVGHANAVSALGRGANGDFDDPGHVSLVMLENFIGIHAEALVLENWSRFFFDIMLILVDLIMINILIAQLVNAWRHSVKNEVAFAMLNRAYICLEMESLLPLRLRKAFFDELGFDNELDFDTGDEGPPGGVQENMPPTIRMDPLYIPDRVLRFTGEASPWDPWPTLKGDDDDEEETEATFNGQVSPEEDAV